MAAKSWYCMVALKDNWIRANAVITVKTGSESQLSNGPMSWVNQAILRCAAANVADIGYIANGLNKLAYCQLEKKAAQTTSQLCSRSCSTQWVTHFPSSREQLVMHWKSFLWGYFNYATWPVHNP